MKKLEINLMKKLKSKKTSTKEQINFFHNLILLLEQGYSLNESIKLLNFRLNLNEILLYLQEGEKFSQILSKLNFDKDILLVIQISEHAGELVKGIKKSKDILEHKSKNKSLLWEQLKYPIILMTTMIIGILFISIFLLPTFSSVYKSFNIELSLGLKMMFLFISFLPKILVVILLITVVLIIFVSKKDSLDRIKFFSRYKILSKNYYELYNQVFVINVTSLFEIGFKLDEIFTILKNQDYNYLLKMESNEILYKLSEGLVFNEILKEQKIYHDDLIKLVIEGEKSGTLKENLKNYLLITQLKKQKKIEKFIFLLQPLLYGIFGIMILVLYASIFIPMFKIMDNI